MIDKSLMFELKAMSLALENPPSNEDFFFHPEEVCEESETERIVLPVEKRKTQELRILNPQRIV